MKPWHALWCQAGVRLLGALWKVCLRNFAEGWVWFEQLPQGFAQRERERERETVKVEEEEEVGRDAKMQRQGEGSRAQRAGMPSQLSVVMGHRPLVADLRNTTIDSCPLLIPPHFFLFPFHPPLSFLIFFFFLLRLTSVYLFFVLFNFCDRSALWTGQWLLTYTLIC